MLSSYTVATFNILGHSFKAANPFWRYKKIAEYFNTSSIDIVQLQEVLTYPHLAFLRKHFSNYPYSAYAKGIVGPRGGSVIFSRHPLKDISYITFPKRHNPSVFTYLAHFLNKGILVARIAQTPLLCMNVHCHAVLNGDWSQTSQYYPLLVDDLETLQKTIERHALDNLVIVSGDFNTAKDSLLYKKICFSSDVHDIFANDLRPTFHKEFLPINRTPHCIDYLLVYSREKKYQVMHTQRIFEERVDSDHNRHYVSDHIGLQATIQIV